jgi:hypothetical protein
MGQSSRSPSTKEEFIARYHQNNTVDNPGTLQAITHLPCPFCAAPDIIVMRALHVQEDLQRGGTCAECGRGIRVIFQDAGNQIQYDVVQTCGIDPPDYIDPKPRRDA